jgi:hypothetical protein
MAAGLQNDRVIPFFDSHDVKLPRVLTGRGSEYCGNPERHEYLPRDRGYRSLPGKNQDPANDGERFRKGDYPELDYLWRIALASKICGGRLDSFRGLLS